MERISQFRFSGGCAKVQNASARQVHSGMGAKKKFLSLAILLNLLSLSGGVSSTYISTEAILEHGDVSLHDCSLEQNCDKVTLSTNLPGLTADGQELARSQWESLGLGRETLHVNSIAVGFVPGFQEKIWPNTPAQINEQLPKPMSIVGDYISIEPWSKDMKKLDWHLPMIKNLKGNPVWCIALMPTDGLDTVTWEVAHRIAQKMKYINEQGVTVWLRFAHEMNGDWYPWGMSPEKFIKKWKLLAYQVKSMTDRTYMLWSPNAVFGRDIHDMHGGYTPYWPGGDSVDIVGLSFYHWGVGSRRLNIAPTQDEAVGKLHDFGKIYGPGGWGKPLVISETAASYTYDQGTRRPVDGGSSEYQIKMTWLHLLLDKYIKQVVPGLRAMIWFEVIKDENATGNTAVHTEDFRLVLGTKRLNQAARAFFNNHQ